MPFDAFFSVLKKANLGLFHVVGGKMENAKFNDNIGGGNIHLIKA